MDNKKTKKIIIIAGSIILVAGIGFMIYRSHKKKVEAQKAKEEEDAQALEDLTDNSDKSMDSVNCNGYTIGYISKRDSSEQPVHLANRPPKGTIIKGDTVNINGTSFDGLYLVKGVWIDSNNNVGALYLNIPYTPNGTKDMTFNNKGCIEV